MSAPNLHPIQNLALEYQDGINQQIEAHNAWYNNAENVAELAFGNAIARSLGYAEQLVNHGYLQPEEEAEMGGQWLEILQTAAQKTKQLISPNTNENRLIYEAFYNQIQQTLLALLRFMQMPQAAEPDDDLQPPDGVQQGVWMLRYDEYKTGNINLLSLIPPSKNKLPDEDITVVEGMLVGDTVVVVALSPKVTIWGWGAITLNPTDSSKNIEPKADTSNTDAAALENYINKTYTADFFKKLNGKDRRLFKLDQQVFEALTQAAAAKKSSFKRLHNYLLSDQYANLEKDALGFKTYADTISGLMMEGSTRPPLNIAVIAPWGRGKTTLMRMVKATFDKTRMPAETPTTLEKDTPANMSDLRKWFKKFSENADFTTSAKVKHATVWFNPWNYQSSEMIWAGLAHAIINQIVEQLPTQKDREAFWFKLKLARVDKQKIRHELHIGLIYVVLTLLGTALTALAALWYFKAEGKSIGAVALGISGAATALLNGTMSFLKPNRKSIASTFTNLTQPPNYDQKLGLFHDVNDDVKKVLHLLADDDKPPIIFVDDLDRCSPSKVVEVIEAINLFMSGEFNTRCYFIIGMDAEIVAAALDVAYEKMKGQIKRNETEQGSIGWYFLDKFIQLPFFIPVLDKAKKEKYLREILGGEDNDLQTQASTALADLPDEAAAVAQLANDLLDCDTEEQRRQLVSQQPKARVEAYNARVVQQQITQKYDDPEIKQQVAVYADYLGGDPRSLKRFANLLRFYGSHQYLRMTLGQPHVQISTLARWLAVMIRFPKMIRWIQWEDDASLSSQQSPGGKAATMDKLLKAFDNNGDIDVAYQLFLGQKIEFLTHKDYPDGMPIAAVHDSHWLKSKLFFQILHINRADEASFVNALHCNVL